MSSFDFYDNGHPLQAKNCPTTLCHEKPNLLHCRFVGLVLFFHTCSCLVHTRGPRLCIDLWLLDLWLLVRGSGTSSDILRKGSGRHRHHQRDCQRVSTPSSRLFCYASWQGGARGLNGSSYGDDSVTSLGKLLWLSLQFQLVMIYMLFAPAPALGYTLTPALAPAVAPTLPLPYFIFSNAAG